MKKSTRDDLKDLSLLVEELVAGFDKLTEADKIDVAASLKPIAKGCEEIDKQVKAMIKLKLQNKAGSCLGGMFKAVLKFFPVTRLDQAALEEGSPKTYSKYLRTNNESRITFELR